MNHAEDRSASHFFNSLLVDWISILGSERLTGIRLDRLTHHLSILNMNGDSYRLKQSAGRRGSLAVAEQNQATAEYVRPDTGEATIR